MPLAIGSRIGPYEITGTLGAGGMGEVYRARDTKLNRDVALKVLPDAFTRDPDRLARFKREAQVLASLNHPHIGAIYGFEDSGETHALVLELVEGPTLADMIAEHHAPEAESLRSRPRDSEAVATPGGGAPHGLPINEALPIAHQIGEALEAAHEQGIIHRDLKPANIKVRADRMVKVLDFGLAKAMEPVAGSSPNVSQSPTITTPAMTQAGMILGTAAYMSPEQARGKPVDKRSDIWAFGAVLFEMLTGARAFAGDDVSEVLASVLAREPNWARLPPATPSSIRTVVQRCLHKDPKQRLRDIGDVRLALEGAFETAASQTSPPSAKGGRLVWMTSLAGVALLGMIAFAIPALRHLRETPPPAPPETRVEIVTPATDRPTDFALSPDGRQIVFVASGDGASRLWLRSLATPPPQPLAGTEGATYPFWSPDSRSVGFFAGSALKRLDIVPGGGAPHTLAPVIAGRGGTWNADGVILFAPGTATPLMRVAATGGAAVAVTTLLGTQQFGHTAPQFLPDSRRFLFNARGISETADTTGLYLGALDGTVPTRLTPGNGAGVFLPAARPGPSEASRGGGWLLWVRTGGTLLAQPLDLAQPALTGEPVTLADGVAAVSVAATGLVAYRTAVAGQRQLTWVDRSGTARGTIGDPDATLQGPRVSPEGRRVAVSRTVQGNLDLWLLDGARTSRFTFDAAADSWPIWSPDGTRIVFRSDRTGVGDLYQKLTSGAGLEERLVASDQPKNPSSWSADGRFLLYFSNDPQSNGDLWVVPMVGDHTPSVVLKTPFREAFGVLSPDGRWVAYQSNESGRPDIYVRPFVPPGAAGAAAGAAGGGGQWQVSTAGGIVPVWRPDGKELFYLNPAGAMMAAPITVTGSTLEPGAPVLLFPTRIVGGGADVQVGRNYDVAPDGRFLITTERDSAAAPITLLMDWNPEAKK